MNRRLSEIKKWLFENNIKQADIAKKAKVSSSAVSLFVQGKGTSANIKRVFLDLGCPEKVLIKEAA